MNIADTTPWRELRLLFFEANSDQKNKPQIEMNPAEKIDEILKGLSPEQRQAIVEKLAKENDVQNTAEGLSTSINKAMELPEGHNLRRTISTAFGQGFRIEELKAKDGSPFQRIIVLERNAREILHRLGVPQTKTLNYKIDKKGGLGILVDIDPAELEAILNNRITEVLSRRQKAEEQIEKFIDATATLSKEMDEITAEKVLRDGGEQSSASNAIPNEFYIDNTDNPVALFNEGGKAAIQKVIPTARFNAPEPGRKGYVLRGISLDELEGKLRASIEK